MGHSGVCGGDRAAQVRWSLERESERDTDRGREKERGRRDEWIVTERKTNRRASEEQKMDEDSSAVFVVLLEALVYWS